MTRQAGRVAAFAAAAAVLLPLGFCARLAEDNQVGSSDDASRAMFIASGLCAYFAGYLALRGRVRRNGRRKAGNGTGTDNRVA